MDDLTIPFIVGKAEEAITEEVIVGTCRCGARWTGENPCHCATCHLTFRSATGFDRHRRGQVDHARCLTTVELSAAGMTPDPDGMWRVPMDTDWITKN